MSQIKYLLLLSVALLAVAAPRASATTYYVGSCKIGSFSTISDALAATPAPDIVYVCPGTYPEQITITNPVTLAGIPSGGVNQVFITAPSTVLSGVCPTTQVCVVSTGPVNITNITVDGTGAKTNGSGSLAGIFYEDSSGTVNEAEVRFQQGTDGVGIEIFQDQGPETVTVENTNIHSFTGWGILTDDDQVSAGATTKIVGNTIRGEPGAEGGIEALGGVSLTITGNVIHGPLAPANAACKAENCVGMWIDLPYAGSITKNTIVGSVNAGIALYPAATATTCQ
jgi:hypothetical protein